MISMREAFEGMRDQLVASRAAEKLKGSFQFEIQGDGGGIFHLVLAEGGVLLGEGVLAEAGCTLVTKAEYWRELMEGTADPRTLLALRKMRLKGDMGLASKLSAFLPKRP